jgi:YHS domain-containing protein
MERDPVCGTFVVRERAISIGAGDRRVYFCSVRCRDKYQARIA